MMTGTRLNDCTPTPDEQAKYANPPEADVMKRLDAALLYDPPHHYVISDGLRQRLLCALTAYGDQRAREGAMRAAIRNYNDADEEIIRAKREARAAAIEAAENIVACDLLFNGTAESRHRLRVAIRALAAGPPQSEGGEG
jgi:hypothetical protein